MAINLSDPNQLVETGLAASKTTGPEFNPLTSNVYSVDPNRTVNEVSRDTAENTAFSPSLLPGTGYNYTGLDPNDTSTYLTNYQTVGGDKSFAPNQANNYAVNPSNTYTAAPPGTYDATTTNDAGFNPGILEKSTYAGTGTNAAVGQVAAGSQYNAYQGQVDPMSMVQNQLRSLLTEGIPEGRTVPDWAMPAVAAARQAMNDMGLGNSTMAGNATAEAILKTALPVAAQNAQIVAQLNSQNTAAINAARQYDAGVVAQLNIQNTQNAQTANNLTAQAVNDANKQNAATLAQLMFQDFAQRQQTLLSNAASENAAKQFNAQSVQQHSQFFANLSSQIAAQNADRMTATSQFNAGQANSVSEFIANMNNQRQEFNAQNSLLVDQSNVQWRRAINTANTAGINATNQANVQNLFNMSQTWQNNLWQQARDEVSWAFTSGESSKNRLLSLVNSSLNRQTSLQILASQLNANMFSQLGSLAGNILSGPIGSGIGNLFGDSSGGGDFSNIGEDFGGGGNLFS